MVSDVWRFCSRLADNLVKCNYCGRVMTYHGTTNLRVHVGRHFGMKPMRNFQTGGFIRRISLPPQPGVTPEGVPSPQQPSASVGHPPIKVEGAQSRESPQQQQPPPQQQPNPVSAPPPPRERPPPLGLPNPAMIAHSMGQGQPPHTVPRRPVVPPQMRAPSPGMSSQQSAPPPEVCLRWNSYHSNMQATFPSLLNNEQFVDVTLACEGHSIKCHKVMLSACSSYFEELLSQNPCQHPIVLMKDLRFWEVQALVDFMYRGEVNVTQDKLPSLLAAAEALQIKGLAGPASNSHDDSRDDYLDPNSPLRRRKRRAMHMPPQDMSQAGMMPVKNPVGRPRLHQPRIAPRPPVAIQPAPAPSVPSVATPSTPRIPMRISTPLSAPPTVLRDDGPPPRRIKHSPPQSPEIKIEPLDADLSNDSIDKLQPPYDRDGGESSGGGESSIHDEPVMNLAHDSERYAINNGLRSDGTRDQSDDERNLDDDDDDDERDRGRENDREHDHDQDQDSQPGHETDQDQVPELDHNEDHNEDHGQDHDMDQDAVPSDDDKEMHSDSEEEGYDDQPPPDSRPEQAENLADRLLGRL